MKQKPIKKTVIFNRRILLFLFAFIATLYFSISFFKSGDKELGIVLIIFSLLISIGVFFTPVCFVFTKNEIISFWLFQYKRVICWASIKSIIEFKWGAVDKDLPKYELIYHINHKGIIITKQFDIPKNKKTKKAIEKYAKHKIL